YFRFAFQNIIFHICFMLDSPDALMEKPPLLGQVADGRDGNVSCLLGVKIQASERLGGFLNATFGNASELIIALVALKQGLGAVAKASLTGSIIGNILLVLGCSMLAGGLRHKVQTFNIAAARVRAMMLTLAAVALIIPAAYHRLADPGSNEGDAGLSIAISIILLLTYGLSLLFAFYTHEHLFRPAVKGPVEPAPHGWS